MKKIMTIFIVIILIIIYMTFIPSAKTQTVFYENSSNYILIDIQKCDINTINFNDYFNEIKVIKIYPNIDKLYENKVEYLKEYSFNNIYTNKENINKFKELYINELNKRGYNVTNFIINGIKINKVKVYLENNDYSLLKNKIKCDIY